MTSIRALMIVVAALAAPAAMLAQVASEAPDVDAYRRIREDVPALGRATRRSGHDDGRPARRAAASIEHHVPIVGHEVIDEKWLRTPRVAAKRGAPK
jgi:hypothetical protein